MLEKVKSLTLRLRPKVKRARGQADRTRAPGVRFLSSRLGGLLYQGPVTDGTGAHLGLNMADLTSQAGLTRPGGQAGGGMAPLPATCHAGHVCAPSSGGERCKR